MWEYIAGDLPYALSWALLYLIGIIVAAFNIRRAGAAAVMVMGACLVLLFLTIAGQLVHAYMASTQQYGSGNVAIGIFGIVRSALDVIATGVLLGAPFVGRKAHRHT